MLIISSIYGETVSEKEVYECQINVFFFHKNLIFQREIRWHTNETAETFPRYELPLIPSLVEKMKKKPPTPGLPEKKNVPINTVCQY